MNLSDRMKLYEELMCSGQLIPRLPVCIRLDGRCFHSKTRRCERPFDVELHGAMSEMARDLTEETVARVAYTQSDEVTLVLWSPREDSQVYFNGVLFKIQSVLAGIAALKFSQIRPEAVAPGCVFDCRVWNVPTIEEAANCILWREQDAARNSVQMAARNLFSHKECHGKNSSELQEMLFSRDVNWNDYPTWAKRGSYIRRIRVEKPLTKEQRLRIPEQFRPAVDEEVERTIYRWECLPRLASIENRVEVLFEGAVPVLRE